MQTALQEVKAVGFADVLMKISLDACWWDCPRPISLHTCHSAILALWCATTNKYQDGKDTTTGYFVHSTRWKSWWCQLPKLSAL